MIGRRIKNLVIEIVDDMVDKLYIEIKLGENWLT